MAKSLGITVDRHPSTPGERLRTAEDLNRVLNDPAILRADAMMVLGSLFVNFPQVISVFAAKHRKPVVTAAWINVKTHFALLGFGPDHFETHRQAADYVDNILKGARPADLPVQQARKFKLVVNLNVAKTLGLKIPPSILLRATDIIE